MKQLSKIALCISATLFLGACATGHSPSFQEALDRAENEFEGGYEENIKKYRPTRVEIGQVHYGSDYHDVNNFSLVDQDNRKLPEIYRDQAHMIDKEGNELTYTVDEFAALLFESYGIVLDVSSPDLAMLAGKDENTPSGLSAQPGSQSNGVSSDSTGTFQQPVNDLIGGTNSQPDRDALLLKPFSYTGDVKGLLDYIAIRNGLKWKFNPDFNKSYLYAFETRSFNVYDFGDQVDVNNTVTTDTNQQSENTNSGSQQEVRRESQINVWEEIQTSVNNMISEEFGKVSYSAKAGMITVTDSDYNLAQVKSYIDKLNKNVSQEVIVDFQIIRFNYSDNDAKGINQNYLNTTLQNNFFGSFDVEFGSGALSPDIQGNLGAFQELLGGNYLSLVTDSQKFLLGFLNKIGSAEIAYKTQLAVLNNDTMTDQRQQSEEYIASIERQNFGESGGRENITTKRDVGVDGVSLTVRPRIIGNEVMLKYGLSTSDFIGLTDAGLGSGLEGIKLKTQGGQNLDQNAKLLNGIPKVVKFTHQYEETTNGQGMFDASFWALGGNENRDKSKSAVIVIATAYYQN